MKYHFDLSKVKDSKTHKQRNRQLFSSSRIHSISVKFIKVAYITISNIIRSYVCPKMLSKTIYDGALKSYNIKDVEFCNIYRRRKTTQLSFIE